MKKEDKKDQSQSKEESTQAVKTLVAQIRSNMERREKEFTQSLPDIKTGNKHNSYWGLKVS